MAVTIPAGFGQINFIHDGIVGTPLFINTLGVDLTDKDAPTVAYLAAQAWAETHMPNVSSNIVFMGCSVTLSDGQGGTGSVGMANDFEPVPGGITGAYPPVAMGVIVQKRTNAIGRTGRGRWFLPCWADENAVGEGGRIRPQDLPGFQAQADDLLGNLSTAVDEVGADPFVLLHENPAIAPTVIRSLAVQSRVGWIRKRIW